MVGEDRKFFNVLDWIRKSKLRYTFLFNLFSSLFVSYCLHLFRFFTLTFNILCGYKIMVEEIFFIFRLDYLTADDFVMREQFRSMKWGNMFSTNFFPKCGNNQMFDFIIMDRNLYIMDYRLIDLIDWFDLLD